MFQLCRKIPIKRFDEVPSTWRNIEDFRSYLANDDSINMLKGPYRTKVLITETDIQMAQSLVYEYLKDWKSPKGNPAGVPCFLFFTYAPINILKIRNTFPITMIFRQN